MSGGLSDELSALHGRRAVAEHEIQVALFDWAMAYCDVQTFDMIRKLNSQLQSIVSKAVLDAYSLPRPGDLPKENT
jgi:hypothetical protein